MLLVAKLPQASKTGVLAALTMLVLFGLVAFPLTAQTNPPALKKQSALYGTNTLAHVRANLDRHPMGKQFREEAIRGASFWKNLPDDDMWNIMFGPKITRSWMVWSNGECPSCRKSVPMYTWRIDARVHRWKVRCPHCAEFFPKNDFHAFYKSGLDEQGIYDPTRADRKLLFNAEHPDPSDPLHRFGVDDGEGYVEGDKRWRFIGAYLIYGEFKQLIVGGVNALATAYIYTGDPVYARKAGILLDRVADVYPTFNFYQQGLVYEKGPYHGYVSTWHDACEETLALVLGYDRVFEGIRNDDQLVAFLSRKAKEYKLKNSKASFAEIQQNIEDNLLRDVLKNRVKIESNFPRSDPPETRNTSMT